MIEIAYLVWGAAIVPGAVALAAAAVGRVWLRPRVDREPVRDVLVLAAHSDDCVVCAGEYAIDAAAAGRRIDILYLTCGDYERGTMRASARDQEALNCWASLGVPPQRITFVGLRSSPVGGPETRHEPCELEQARAAIETALKEVPAGAAIIVPAAGETHSDHRLLRRLAAEAISNCGRGDLMFLESPEYNPYVSLVRTPGRAIRTIVRWIPLLSRVIPTEWMSGRAGFVSGGRGLVRPPSATRLAAKRHLFTYFVSEKPDLLVEYFGSPDLYRRLAAMDFSESSSGYWRVGSRMLGVSTLLLMWTVLSLQVLTAAALGEWIRRLWSAEAFTWVILIVALAIVIKAVVSRSEFPRRFGEAGIGVGLLAGATGLAGTVLP